MTDQEINEAIALHLGWKRSEREVEHDFGYQWTEKAVTWTSPDGRAQNNPDRYCSDLNAVREAARALTQKQLRRYADEVCEIVCDVDFDADVGRLLLASPKELSIAMVRAIGKWRTE